MSTIQLYPGAHAKQMLIIGIILVVMTMIPILLNELAGVINLNAAKGTCLVVLLVIGASIAIMGAEELNPQIKDKQVEDTYGISAFHFNRFITPSIDDNDSYDVRFIDAQGKPQTGKAVIKDRKMTLYVYDTGKALKLYKAEAK